MSTVAETVDRDRRRRTGSRAVLGGFTMLLLCMLIANELVKTVWVSSDSMAPTVCTGGVVLVAKRNASGRAC